jgi:hypothetical protein
MMHIILPNKREGYFFLTPGHMIYIMVSEEVN